MHYDVMHYVMHHVMHHVMHDVMQELLLEEAAKLADAAVRESLGRAGSTATFREVAVLGVCWGLALQGPGSWLCLALGTSRRAAPGLQAAPGPDCGAAVRHRRWYLLYAAVALS